MNFFDDFEGFDFLQGAGCNFDDETTNKVYRFTLPPEEVTETFVNFHNKNATVELHFEEMLPVFEKFEGKEFTMDELLEAINDRINEIINNDLWQLVKEGFVDMSVDENGEFIFFLTEKGKNSI